MHPSKIKYLGINLTKKVKDFYAENYKTLSRKLKRIQSNGKVFHARLEELIFLNGLRTPNNLQI